jgi:FAD/FMN-containing dehydrogenase
MILFTPRPIDFPCLALLSSILGPDGLRTGERAAAIDPGIDSRNLRAGVVALPATTEETIQVVRLCREHHIPIVPIGGRTGLAGGGVSRPGELVLLTSRLNDEVRIDPAAGTAVAGPGVTLSVLAKAAADHGLTPAIDLGARDSCTIGGLVSTNAGGMEAFRHGTMRRRVLGLEAVLPDASHFHDMTEVLKSNEGYDLKQLFIGAEGTLGIVTRAVLKLEADPGERSVGYCHCSDAAAALRLLNHLRGHLHRRSGALLTRAEFMWANHVRVAAEALGLPYLAAPAEAAITVIFEAASPTADAAREAIEAELGSALEAPGLIDVLLPKNDKEARDIWRLREDWSVDRVFPGGLWYDISVPLGRLDDYMRRLEARLAAHDPAIGLYAIGHLADGNVHVTINSKKPVKDRAAELSPFVYEGLKDMGGSFSAEHGIGLEKREALATYGDPVKLDCMRRIKRLLDPDNIMNPGKVVG